MRLLASVALGIMMFGTAAKASALDDMPEEEVKKAVENVLRKNPKIAFDAVEKFKADTAAARAVDTKLTGIEEKIALILRENPTIVVGALQAYEQDQQQQELMKTAEVYQKHIAEINNAEIFAGNPQGKIVLVEFFDFSCGYCKQMAPRIKNIIDKNKDVKVIFKPVAFLSPISETAAKAAIAAHQQGKYMEMYQRLMKENRLSEASINSVAKELGLDMKRFEKDLASRDTQKLINSIKATADKIEMRSVPTLVLNGMPLYAVEEEQLQRAVDVIRTKL